MPKAIRRGYAPTDEKDFSAQNLKLLCSAQQDIFYLLCRGYGLERAVTFVGDRFQFSARQRMALARATCSRKELLSRREKERTRDFCGAALLIDGFNVIIPLEIALSDSTLIRCMDETLRDLAGLHGSYRLICQTDAAIGMIGRELTAMRIAEATFILDAPVSNAGRLRQRILELLQSCPFRAKAVLSDHADGMLYGKHLVATGDSVILDRCGSWVNLVARILEDSSLSCHHVIDLSLPGALGGQDENSGACPLASGK